MTKDVLFFLFVFCVIPYLFCSYAISSDAWVYSPYFGSVYGKDNFGIVNNIGLKYGGDLNATKDENFKHIVVFCPENNAFFEASTFGSPTKLQNYLNNVYSSNYLSRFKFYFFCKNDLTLVQKISFLAIYSEHFDGYINIFGTHEFKMIGNHKPLEYVQGFDQIKYPPFVSVEFQVDKIFKYLTDMNVIQKVNTQKGIHVLVADFKSKRKGYQDVSNLYFIKDLQTELEYMTLTKIILHNLIDKFNTEK